MIRRSYLPIWRWVRDSYTSGSGSDPRTGEHYKTERGTIMQFLKAGTLVRIMPSEFVKDKYWNLRGRVATYNAERDLYRIESPGLDDRKIWVALCDLIEEKETETCDGFIPAKKEEKKPLEDNVREDPPVAVPGFITVTAAPQSFLLSFSEKRHVREMIDIRDILCVIEQDNGRAMIVRRSDENKPAVPLLVTVEDFDEVARRMRGATEHAEDHRD